MKIALKHCLIGLSASFITFVVSLIGFVLLFASGDGNLDVFKYFTVLSNALVLVSSLLGLVLYALTYWRVRNYVFKWFQVFRLVSVVAVGITFTMVVIFLAPADPSFGWFANYNLFMHLLTPIVAMLSFAFFEYITKINIKSIFTPTIFVIVYGIFYIIYAFSSPSGTSIDWYGFLFRPENRIAPASFSNINWGTFFIFLLESLGAALLFAFVFYLINKIMNKTFANVKVEGENKKIDVSIKVVKDKDLKNDDK